MKILRLRCFTALALLLAPLTVGRAVETARPSEKDGMLVVKVTWDDVDRTPAHGLYIEAHGFAVNGVLEKSFVFKMVNAGRYEAALPPGVYDVFVSEASSSPRCRRVLITTGHTGYWNLMLEHDDVYLQR
jgi:hypothetical protein